MKFRFVFPQQNVAGLNPKDGASNSQMLNLDDLLLRKYQDIIHESKAISEFLFTNKNALFFTDDKSLASTVNCMLEPPILNRDILLNDFLLKSSMCFFSLNKSKYIDLCSSHPFISFELRSPNKLISLKSQIKESLERIGIKSLCYKQKYSFSDLLEAHFYFANRISSTQIEQPELEIDRELVTIYEYLKILKEKLTQKSSDNFEMKGIFSLEQLNSENIKYPFWIGGLSDETNLTVSQLENILRFSNSILSYSSLKNSCKRYPNSLLKNIKILSFEEEHPNTMYRYSDPKPPISIRKNSFAINHITKLLNNPYQFYIEGILGIKQHSFHQNHTIGILIHAVFEECIKNTLAFESLDQMNKEICKIIKSKNLSKIDELIVSKKIYLMSKTLWPIIKDAEELYPEKEGIQEISHNKKTYLLHGRADLIYKDKNERYGVIDFKTGSIPSWINILNGSAPQISVEILMLKFGGFIDKDDIKITKSGFIWPKGFLEVKEEDVINPSIDGIKKLIETFWIEEKPYIYTNDSRYGIIARDFQNENY